MEKEESAYRAHILVLPYPVQGHMNPMLQFSKRLASKGLEVTLVITRFVAKSMHAKTGSIRVELISDGFDENGFADASSVEDYLDRLKVVGSQTLIELIERQRNSGDPVVNWMAKQWTIRTIGPTVPSMYLDKRVEGDKDYGLDLFEPSKDACLSWLNTKETGSVVYVSFGSIASPGAKQMEELAWGLRESNNYFLWVVRASEENKLPSKFMEETLEKGLVVTWCPQLEVLSHQAVGCFVTHCGWNSTLEALSLGKPMVALLQWTDQATNAKYVEDVWSVGLRARADNDGISRRKEIEACIREVMDGEIGNERKRNVSTWKELAKEAVDVGGSSDKNVKEFVTSLVCQ